MNTMTMSRLGFLDLPSTLEPQHRRAITTAREHASSAVAELSGFAADMRRDPDLKETGIQKRLHAGLAEVATHLTTAFSAARKEIEADRYQAATSLTAKLWSGVGDPARVVRSQAELLTLVGQHPVNAREVMTDSGTGQALLASGGRVLSLLDSLISEGDLDDARLLTLALHHGGPILKALVGGKPVMSAMLNKITERLVATDADAARHQAAIDAADGLLSMISSRREARPRLRGPGPRPARRRCCQPGQARRDPGDGPPALLKRFATCEEFSVTTAIRSPT